MLAAVLGICFFRFAMPILCGMLFLVLDEVAAVVRLRGNVADQREIDVLHLQGIV